VSVLLFETVSVDSERVEAIVRVPDSSHSRTSAAPGLADRALGLLPGLRRHSCENGSAHGICAELGDTETPHLLEHLAFELMALSGSPRTLRGETAWDFSADGVGVYRVRLAYDNDLVALGALKSGSGIVDWLFSGSASGGGGVPVGAAQTPDVDALVAALRHLR